MATVRPAFFKLAIASLVGALCCTAPAAAATFNATELSYDKALLSQFNLINLGNYSSVAKTEGRVVVGGSATGSSSASACVGTACSGNTSFGASSSVTGGTVASGSGNPGYGALTVFNNLTGGFSVGRGDIDVGGNAPSGTYNLNGKGAFNVVGGGLIAGGSGLVVNSPTTVKEGSLFFLGTVNGSGTQSASAASVFPFGNTATDDFGAPMKALSAGIAALPGSPGVTAQTLPANQNALFTAGADYTVRSSDGSITRTYGVVTTSIANLASAGSGFSVANGSNDATFVIVTGDGAGLLLPSLAAADSRVIYDFVDATTLRFAAGFNGSILAPLATITQQGGAINGSVVVQSMTQTAALLQGNAFTGDISGLSYTPAPRVPEPGGMALAVLGFAAVILARWHSQARTSR